MKRQLLNLSLALLMGAACVAPMSGAGNSNFTRPRAEKEFDAAAYRANTNNSLRRLPRNNRVVDQSKLFGSPDRMTLRVTPSGTTAKSKTERLMTRSAEEPRGHIYGAVCSYQDMVYFRDAFWGEINTKTGAVSKLYSGNVFINGNDYDIQGGAVRGDVYYTPVVEADDDFTTILWNRINIQTGEVLTPISFGGDWAAYCYSMTYNAKDDKIYGLSVDPETGVYNRLTIVSFNQQGRPEVENAIYLNSDEHLGAIAYCPLDQNIYIFGSYNGVYVFSPRTETINRSGELLYTEDIIANLVATQIVYSPLDFAFIVAYRDLMYEEMRLLYIDPESWEITDGVKLGGGRYVNPYFISLYCPDPFAPQEAPAQGAEPVVNVAGSALTGTYTFTVPTHNFAGIQLDAATQIAVELKLDGKAVISKNMTPGQTETYNINDAAGLHTFELTFTLDGKSSPVRTTLVMLGHDNPKAPANVKVDGTTISWTAPGALGEHEGYVDTSALTYDVFFDGVKQNSEPIVGSSYTFVAPDTFTKRSITVTATANGMTSLPGSTTSIIGKAIELPVNIVPHQNEKDGFTIINSNNDERSFEFELDRANGANCFSIYLSYNDNANDWLIMPLLSMPEAEHLYSLSFVYGDSQSYYENGDENLDVYIGRKPTVSAMTTNIYSHRNYRADELETISTNFAVPEGGDWYIGFHCSSKGGNAGGIRLSNFQVQSLKDLPSSVPADPTSVKLTPGPEGDLFATATVVLPTLDLVGNALPADQDITVTMANGLITSKVTGKPGQTVSLNCDGDFNGFTTYTITPSNSFGSGLSRRHIVYIGYDVPLAPSNIKSACSADNKSVTVSWTKPGSVGKNGGYVDVDNLLYTFYTVDGITFIEEGNTRDTQFTFTPRTRKTQYRYVLGPTAQNEIGESYESNFLSIVLGAPYSLPVKEEFGNNGWSYEPIFFNQRDEYKEGFWNSINTVLTFGTGVGLDCDNGALVVYNTGSVPCKGELVLPKVTTKGSRDAFFTLRYLDWAHTPVFHVYATSYQHENEAILVGDVTPEFLARGKWVDYEIPLPAELQDCEWVQFFLRCDLTTDQKEYGFIDSYTVGQDVDNDFKLLSLEGPSESYVGDNATYNARVLNSGRNNMEGTLVMRVKDKDGNVLTRQDYAVSRTPSNKVFEINYKTFFQAGYDKLSPLTVEAEIIGVNDEIDVNNIATCEVIISRSMAPAVTDLTATRTDDGSARLSWSTPDLSYGGQDGFEMLEPFVITEDLGLWKNIDMDKGWVWGLINGTQGVEWPGFDHPQAWTVIDPSQFGAQFDERLGGHGGKQYLMARGVQCTDGDPSTYVQAADWLISPEVVGGTDLDFWYCALSADYVEYVELWYSSTDDKLGDEIVRKYEESSVGATCGSFKYFRTFSKSGEDAWEFVSQKLPDDAKYFALVYRSWDSFGAMIDDIRFTQAKPAAWEVDSYNVFRTTDNDWNTYTCVTPRVEGTSFVDETVGDKNATYFVHTIVKSGEKTYSGPRSNGAKIYSSSVGEIGVNNNAIRGGKGCVIIEGLNGQNIQLVDIDGRIVLQTQLTADRVELPAAVGPYLVRTSAKTVKVLVK